MGYTTSDGRWADTIDLDLSPAVALTEDGYSAEVELGDRAVARLTLAVTSASGTTPTLDVTMQTSSDGETWYTAGTFTQATTLSHDADGVLTAQATSTSAAQYTSFDGAIGAEFDAPCYASATLSDTAGAFVDGSTVTITGTRLGDVVTDILTISGTDGNTTLYGDQLFDTITQVDIEAQADTDGTISIGVTVTETEQKLIMLDRYVRASFDVGGTTPSYGVILSGEAA